MDQIAYTFSLQYTGSHKPFGGMEVEVDGEIPKLPTCPCEQQGGYLIQFETMTILWQHKVFALCLESKKEVGEQTQWGLIVEVHPRGAHKKGQLLATPHRVVKTPYDITYADGINKQCQYTVHD